MNTGRACIRVALLTGVVCSVGSAQWSAPQNVSRIADGVVAWYPSLAVDSTGTLHASWSHRMNQQTLEDWIEYSCKPAGLDTWTTPARVSRDALPLRGSAIGIGPGQVPYVVWQSDEVANDFYMTYRCGDTWAIPDQCPGWNDIGINIRATSDRFGRMHVVWAGMTTGDVWYARYDTTHWDTPTRVRESFSRDVDVRADRQGYARVVARAGHVWYFAQTDTGWTATPVPRGDSTPPYEWPRLALDSQDMPAVVWEAQNGHCYLTYLAGDTWAWPLRLDTISRDAYTPSVCFDRWGGIHTIYSGYRTLTGVQERTYYRGRWREYSMVDLSEGNGELAVCQERLDLLWEKGAPNARDVWYSCRDLSAPGICDAALAAEVNSGPMSAAPLTPDSRLEYVLQKPGKVAIELLDSSGRLFRSLDLGTLPVGRHEFRPYSCLPSGGVYFCRVLTEGRPILVKLVKAD